jgi:hypothetical protein
LEENPFVWWVKINNIAVDARDLPLNIQEELDRRGLIPFVPRGRQVRQKV